MSQNTIEAGRTKALVPEFRFDTIDGGSNLFDTMFNLYSRLSDDSISCRTKSFNLLNTGSILFEHNINQSLSELEVKIFINGSELKEEEISSYFSITSTSDNSLSLQNISGSTKAGWLVVSGIIYNRHDSMRFRERTNAPTSPSTGEIVLYAKNNNVFAKNSTGTVMGLTDSTVIQCPPGVVLSFAGTVLPSGFLWCDGSAVSRTTYANLFASIGIAHGQGDGSTTFHLPDYRGRFLRGVDGTANNDPNKSSRTAQNTGGNTGNNVGSIQGSSFASHNHTQNSHNHTQDSHNHTQNQHTHTQDAHNHTQNAHDHSYSAPTALAAQYTAGSKYGFDIIGATTGSTTATNNAETATNQYATATNQATTATNQATTATNQATGGDENRPLNTYVNFIIKY